MMRRLRNFWLGRRGSTAPGARLRRVVEEAAIEVAGVRADVLQVERRAAPQLALEVEAPLILAGVGQIARRRDHVGPAPTGPTTPVGLANDSVGFAGSEV